MGGIAAEMSLILLWAYPVLAVILTVTYLFFQFSSWIITLSEPQDFADAVAGNKTNFGDFGRAFFWFYARIGFALVGALFIYGAVVKAFNRWLPAFETPRRWIPGAETRNGILCVVFLFALILASIQVAMNGKTVTVENTDGSVLFNAAAWSFFIGLVYLVALLTVVLVLNVLDYDPEEEEQRLAALGPVAFGPSGAGYNTVDVRPLRHAHNL